MAQAARVSQRVATEDPEDVAMRAERLNEQEHGLQASIRTLPTGAGCARLCPLMQSIGQDTDGAAYLSYTSETGSSHAGNQRHSRLLMRRPASWELLGAVQSCRVKHRTLRCIPEEHLRFHLGEKSKMNSQPSHLEE